MDDDNLADELLKISEIQKILNKVSTNPPKSNNPLDMIENIEAIEGFATKFVDGISSGKVKITEEVMTILNHELRTPIVPILAYGEMLLDGHFGTLNSEQEERMKLMVSSIKQLQQKIESLLDRRSYQINTNNPETDHKTREWQQEKKILEKINDLLNKKIDEENSEITKLKDNLTNLDHQKTEAEQEKKILNRMIITEEKKISHLGKKNISIIAISAVVASIGFVTYSMYVEELMGQQYRVPNQDNTPSNYVIQNLQGDTVNTWVAWNIENGRIIHVHVTNTANLPQNMIDAIKDAILSTKTVSIDDSLTGEGPKGTASTYYVGWEGATEDAYKPPTQRYVPQKFDVSGSPDSLGDIEVILTNDVSPDGYSGYTKSLADGNEILKSKIIIYKADKLTPERLEAIMRHEFGHALGLAHSTATEDLMSPMLPDYPYISGCDIDAIKGLYDGDKDSKVVCKK
ncbi:Peptidase M10A and M12B matrixin and adamalysin [Nitrosotalea sinensis]|jgi:hypothetical protein|uniref:Peptidase M10A and M12B matrixin and adamalysin n=1 Tax=Nitrosotalea sinensis TaxID=1499975 RepID=A0A2H1EGM4_9ARCH|nr:histidine kinase dimerization/phospho-acceptor domain-containing protein [Candidatus Nitrosotalea sinensis]SHO45566.1 Peptidase M10A and M12B matrixin and adamalysin [Candidatus Nitrosotalea sinensis]